MIIPILLLALILRLINLNQSLWLDESINILAAKNLGFWHFVLGYPIGDFHPPGYFALLWVGERLFGISEIATRMPSVILGVATVYLTFLIGKQLFNRKIGLLGALILALNPLHVYYSQEARMYSLAAFAVTLSFFCLLKILETQKKYWFWYLVSIVLILLSDYVAYLAIPVQLLYVIIYFRKKIKLVLLLQFLAGLIFSPWLLIFPNQLVNGAITAKNIPGWALVVGSSSAKSLALVYIKAVIGRITIADKTLYALVLMPIGLLYLLIFSKLIKKIDPKNALLIYWTFLPSLLAFLASFFIPVLSYFRMIFILPGFCLLIVYSISLFSQKLQKILLFGVLLISCISLFFYYTNPAFQRENWKGLEKYFESNQADSLVLFENNEVIRPFSYYLLDVKPKNIYLGGLKNFPAKTTDDVIEIKDYQKIYLVDYLVQISDPNRTIDKKLTSMGYKVVQAKDYPSVGIVYEYQK